MALGWFGRTFRRLAQDEGERRSGMIRAWAETLEGVTLIERARSRTEVRVAGVVEGMRVRPREGVPAIEALVSDGTGTVTAIWLGRRTLPGLTLGCRILLEGRLGGGERDLQIMNPRYEFVAAQSG